MSPLRSVAGWGAPADTARGAGSAEAAAALVDEIPPPNSPVIADSNVGP